MKVDVLGAFSQHYDFHQLRGRVTKVLVGAARGEMVSKCGEGRLRLLDVDTRELARFQN